ncbi:MAG: Hsp20/alpha crystallin family protein [Candidatus Limnocylindrales bacterium]
MDGDILTISGEFKAEEDQPGTEYHRRELYIGTFERVLRLPERFEAEKAEPVFEHGILTITIPKVAQVAVKHIKVQPRASEAVEGTVKR